MKQFNFTSIIVVAFLATSCGSGGETDRLRDISPDNAPDITAQDSGTPVTSGSLNIREDATMGNTAIVEYPSDRLRSTAQAHLNRMGKSLNTINSDGTVYTIGFATTAVASNANGFIASRNIAYARAEMRAKIDILRLSGEQITSERSSTLIDRAVSGQDPDAQDKASMLQKALRVVDASLDRALSELGVSQAEIARMNQQEKERVYEETFYSYVSSFVSGLIRGITTLQIVEGDAGRNDYQVAVLVKYDPELQNLAARFPELGADQNQLNSPIVDQLRTINPEELLSKMGSQVFRLPDGSRVLVGYGQSSYRATDSRQSNQERIAFSRARLQAVESIKNMIAEDLISKEVSESIEKVIEYADGTGNMYSEENYSELIESRASTINMNTFELRQWKAVHPVSEHIVTGSIVILTERISSLSTGAQQTGNNQTSATERSEFLQSTTLEGQEW
jgi:hypothetical protein